MKEYDYLIVGSGLYGAVFAYEMSKNGAKCLVIDKRNHIAGNIYTSKEEGINVHKYGAHIFHTNNKNIWDYINQFATFNNYINSPLAFYKNQLFNLPFNMNTFYQLWGVKTPQEAKDKIEKQTQKYQTLIPINLEEQALKLVGDDIYQKLIKGYSEKQWGRKATDIPSFIINRLPIRYTFNNNYFHDVYQGMPIGGYTAIVEKMLSKVEVKLSTDYFLHKEYFDSISHNIIYTGKIDEFFNYQFGSLEYRSLRFEEQILDIENFQGNAVVNYTDIDIPYTRIIEHKHFEFGTQQNTIISKEYSQEGNGNEPFYPINDDINNKKYLQYKELSKMYPNITFGGRLAEYKYYDMHQIIEESLIQVEKHKKVVK
jgi:UDP-galactopyranose mutase